MSLSSALVLAVSSGWLSTLEWTRWDTWVVVTAALAAMSCTLPGVWLVLRQQSMMGDALSHTALPGVVISFLLGQWLHHSGWLSLKSMLALEPFLLVGGAIVIGVLTAILTESVQKLGRVESNAALGVVFTSLFALGLLLVRLLADDIHLDPDCVLFGQLELSVLELVPVFGFNVPIAVLTNGGLLLLNGILLLLFFKELRVAAFDPEMSTSLGIHAGWTHYLLMGVTAATVVTAFTSVGSILVVAILIVPAACGQLICHRLSSMICCSLAIAAGSALLGHVLAKTVPSLLFVPLGFSEVQDASTPGMVAVTCGVIFFLVMVFAPQDGVLGRAISRMLLIFKMATDDVLATLYRREELASGRGTSLAEIRKETSWISPLVSRLVLRNLKSKGMITGLDQVHLTPSGMEQAALLVRSHRLWESYLHKHFQLNDGSLHESADRVEHFLDRELQTQLDQELDSPEVDPQGKSIPSVRQSDSGIADSEVSGAAAPSPRQPE